MAGQPIRVRGADAKGQSVLATGRKAPPEIINLGLYGLGFRGFFGVSQAAMEKRLFDLGYECMFGRTLYANVTNTSANGN